MPRPDHLDRRFDSLTFRAEPRAAATRYHDQQARLQRVVMRLLDLLRVLKCLKRGFTGELQAGDVLFDGPIDVLEIDTQVVVHQDIPEPRQPLQSTAGCDVLMLSLSR